MKNRTDKPDKTDKTVYIPHSFYNSKDREHVIRKTRVLIDLLCRKDIQGKNNAKWGILRHVKNIMEARERFQVPRKILV